MGYMIGVIKFPKACLICFSSAMIEAKLILLSILITTLSNEEAKGFIYSITIFVILITLPKFEELSP